MKSYVAKELIQIFIPKIGVDMFGLHTYKAIKRYIVANAERGERIGNNVFYPYNDETEKEAMESEKDIAKASLILMKGERVLFIAVTCLEYGNGLERGYKNFAKFSDADFKKIATYCEFDESETQD